MISEKALISKSYKILSQMKSGSGGNVYLVEHTISKEKFVLKSSFVEKEKMKQFEEQMNFWKKFCSEDNHFVLLKEYFFDGPNACVVMEFCEGGDLDTLIKKRKQEKRRFIEKEILKILLDVMKGLKVMHKLKIIHRDIKTANILIDKNGIFRIADFNVSRLLNASDVASTMAGTILYSAPEVLENESYSFPIDIYSVGAVIYELMTLANAFTSMSRILANKYVPVNPELGYSDELVELTSLLMSKNPADRPTAAAVLRLPFLLEACVQVDLDEMRMALERERSEGSRREGQLMTLVRQQGAEIAVLTRRVEALEKEKIEGEKKMKAEMRGEGGGGGEMEETGFDVSGLLSSIGDLAKNLPTSDDDDDDY